MANGLLRKPEMKKTMLYWNTQILIISDTRPPSLPLDPFLPFCRIVFAQHSNEERFVFMLLKDLKNHYAVSEYEVFVLNENI